MASGTIVLTSNSSQQVLAADPNRDHYTLQLITQSPLYLAFGETAVSTKGLYLAHRQDSVEVWGAKARLQCNAYPFSSTPTIVTETFEGVTFRSGPNMFPTS